MTKKRLNTAKIGTIVEQMSGKGVTELMGTERGREARTANMIFQEQPNGAMSQALAALVDEKGPLMNRCLMAVPGQRLQRERTNGNNPFARTFAQDAYCFAYGIEISHFE